MIAAMNDTDWSLRTLFADVVRFLSFRAPGPGLRTHPNAYLAFGLIATWLAGIGRYWDNPRAEAWQLAGLGSLAYVLVLALFVWIVLLPLRPARWSLRNVLTFVVLTAPPALLYAIPVERFLPLTTAAGLNAGFLAVVATWRVALYAVFLRRVAQLSAFAIVVGTLLPLTAIVVTLTLFNLEHVMFDLMAGIRPEQASGNDTAYLVVLVMGVLSLYAFPILLIGYIVAIIRASYRRGRDKA
jgi:hypothetical protein